MNINILNNSLKKEGNSYKILFAIGSGEGVGENDFEITYCKDTKQYSFNIEVIYEFDNGQHSVLNYRKMIKYLKTIYDTFIEWLHNVCCDEIAIVDFNTFFYCHNGYENNQIYHSISELAAGVDFYINGYIQYLNEIVIPKLTISEALSKY